MRIGELTQEWDTSGLTNLRNRYYDATSGQFTQQDPIGLAGGLNLYGYAGGDPVNRSDPFGLSPDTIEVQSHEVIGGMEHASVRVTPADQARWCNDSRFATGETGSASLPSELGPSDV